MIRSASLDTAYQTAFTNGRDSAVADVPVEKGGNGCGFGPHELLEAALATCLTMTVQMAARKHDIPVTAVRCEVRIDRTNPAAACLQYELSFDGPLTDEQAKRLREAAAKCPVARTLTGSLTIEPTQFSEEAGHERA